MSDKSPFGLEEWLKYLKDKKLPVGFDNLTRLRHQIQTPDEALDRLQSNIASEPFLAFIVLSEANKVVQNKRTDIKTPSHAASMVGMNGLSRVIGRLYPCKFSERNRAHQHFLKEVQISYEAASIAKRWAIERRSSNDEEVFWITFFRDAVRWLMWFYTHDAMLAVEEKIKQGVSLGQAEERVLGCRMDILTVKLFQAWDIPLVIINTFLTDHIPSREEMNMLASLSPDPEQIPGYTEDKRLTILANGSPILAYCASKVAHEANDFGWGSHSLTLYYQAISSVLHVRQGKAIQATHLATAEAAKLFAISSKIPLAAQLLSPQLYTRSKQAKGVTKAAPKNAAPTKAAPQKTDPFLWLQKRLSTPTVTGKQAISDSFKVIRSVVQNTQHGLVLSFSKSENRIRPQLQFGYDPELLKKINWNSESILIKRLLQQRSAFNLPSAKLKQSLKSLPLQAQQLVDENGHLLVASCPHKNGDVTIFWLDTRKQFSENEYNNLKRVLTLTGKKLA